VEKTSTKKTSSQDKDKQPVSMQQRIWREVRGYAEAIIIALIVTTFLFTTVGVAGSSMYPSLDGGSTGNLLDSFFRGDRLFVPKYETWLRRAGVMSDYHRGDIVIFRENADSPCRAKRRDGSPARRAFLVKRMIGLPGDHVVVDADGNVLVNDTLIDQSFITDLPEGRVGPNQYPPTDLIVPEGHYFVLGDNRTHSCDSRYYGVVPFISFAGRATAIIWPPMRNGGMNWKALRPPETFSTIPNP
jgi:signal peptidase I